MHGVSIHAPWQDEDTHANGEYNSHPHTRVFVENSDDVTGHEILPLSTCDYFGVECDFAQRERIAKGVYISKHRRGVFGVHNGAQRKSGLVFKSLLKKKNKGSRARANTQTNAQTHTV